MSVPLSLDADDFNLLGLPLTFTQDASVLMQRWKALQAEVHPDRHAAAGPAAQRVAMQWAVRVNEAYQRLKDPVQRAAYLCELRGAPVEAERNTAMPAAFLMQQMAWRESLEDACDIPAIEALQDEVAAERLRLLDRVAQCLDPRPGDPGQAAQCVRALMFVSRFESEIDRRLEALDA